MNKKKHQFNEIVRKVRKDLFGKGPDSIKTVFAENMAITTLEGNLTPVEKFIMQNPEGFEQIHRARTWMVQEYYKHHRPVDMEEIAGSNLLNLFSDINLEKDIAMSIFVFEEPLKEEFHDSVKKN